MVKVLGISLPPIQQVTSSPWVRRACVVTAVATGALFALWLYNNYARPIDLFKGRVREPSSETRPVPTQPGPAPQGPRTINGRTYFSEEELDQIWGGDDLQARRSSISKMTLSAWDYVSEKHHDRWKEILESLSIEEVKNILQKYSSGNELNCLIQNLNQEVVNRLIINQVQHTPSLTIDQLNNLSDDAKQLVLQHMSEWSPIVWRLDLAHLEAIIGFVSDVKERFSLMSKLPSGAMIQLQCSKSISWSSVLQKLSSLNAAEKQETWWKGVLYRLYEDEIKKLSEENLPLFWPDLKSGARERALPGLTDETVKNIVAQWLAQLECGELLTCIRKGVLSQEQLHSLQPEKIAGIFSYPPMATVDKLGVQERKELAKKLYMQLSEQNRRVFLEKLSDWEISRLYCEQILVDLQTHYPDRLALVLSHITDEDYISFINGRTDNLSEMILLNVKLPSTATVWQEDVVEDATWMKLFVPEHQPGIFGFEWKLNPTQLNRLFPAFMQSLKRGKLRHILSCRWSELSPENREKLQEALARMDTKAEEDLSLGATTSGDHSS